MFNYDYKTIQSLKYVKYRKVYNKYIVEGKRIVESALIKKVNSGPIFCTDNFYRDNKNWIQTKIDKKVLVKKINEKHFKKMTDMYEEKNYERTIRKNLANSISQKLILKLAVN